MFRVKSPIAGLPRRPQSRSGLREVQIADISQAVGGGIVGIGADRQGQQGWNERGFMAEGAQEITGQVAFQCQPLAGLSRTLALKTLGSSLPTGNRRSHT
jgi:hypothetical protein